jgi:hypothetical protein
LNTVGGEKRKRGQELIIDINTAARAYFLNEAIIYA